VTCTFHSDLASSQQAIEGARRELLTVVDSVSRAGMEQARKGGWPVRRVLEHVIHSEHLYGQAIAYLAGAEVPARPSETSPASAAQARTMLLDARTATLKALEELDLDPRAYETFYELRKVGHEEYSVLSVLENVANHDGEHAEQIKAILASGRAGEQD
jgi:uncharacterized damage-inducible protein DinB